MEKCNFSQEIVYWKIVLVNFSNLNRIFAWDFLDMLVGIYIYQNTS